MSQRKIKQWINKGDNFEITGNGQYGIKPIDLAAPLPFQYELQHLYDSIEVKLNKKKQKIIAITSSTHNEGNSTLASYYALLLYRGVQFSYSAGNEECLPENTESSNRVLLIDANFRNPAIHKYFNLRNDVGFAELLQNKVDMKKTFDLQKRSKLTIVTAGRSIENVRQVLQHGSLEHYIKSFNSYYNYIIIDSAPILPYWDALIIGQLCDGVILNIKSETVKREVVLKAKKKLDEAKVNILGAVLNRRKYHIPEFIYNLI